MSKQLETVEEIEVALGRTEQFIEKNRNMLIIVLAAVVGIVGIYMIYTRLYLKSQEEKALSQMYVAEQYFEKDSFKLALNGDGNYPGFAEIANKYGITRAGNVAHYYAGISFLHLGQYDNAIAQLKEFDSNDKILIAVAKGAMGDAYMQKGDKKEALSFYLKAADIRDNFFTAPIYLKKAGLVYEETNENEKALDVYSKIKKNYPESSEARDIDKYIARVNFKLNK